MKSILVIVLSLMPAAWPQNKPKQMSSPQGSQAQKWDDRPLVDTGRSNCGVETARAAPRGMCPVSVGTTTFGMLMTDGTVARFDDGGNAKAMEALRRSKKGSKAVVGFWKSGKIATEVRADIMGTLTGDTLNVESVRVK